ncbi:serine/threonine-protein kinase [Streptomyces sp. NPDC003952]
MGDQLADRYRLEQRLGQGGMGEVWRAQDTALERAVAVKVLLEAATNDELVARFRREATIGARLQHPGITVVHDVGQEDGRLFIVMELLAGEDLRTALLRAPGGMPVAAALDLAAQTAEALAAAHERAVIHRDLKPANLFLLPGGRLKICDFGIAHSSDATAGWTVTGRIFGSPPYMAPEQWRGERVDARCDLYALGGVLYALLSGEAPFGEAESPYVLMRRHIEDPPLPLRTAGAPVAPEVERLVRQLLAKDPADRPESAAVVAKELRGLLGGSSAAATTTATTAAPEPAPDGTAAAAPGDGGRGGTGGGTGGGAGDGIGAGDGTGSGAGGRGGTGGGAAGGSTAAPEDGVVDEPVAGGRGPVVPGAGQQFLRDLLTEVEDTLLLLPADSESRIEILGTAADTAARFDADLARRLLRDAEAAAWTAGRHDGARVARHLLRLSGSIAAHAPARSHRLLTDAHQALFTVPDPDRAGLLREVAGKLLKVDPEQARQISEHHLGNDPEDRPLIDRIQKAAIASDPEWARLYLDFITDPGQRAAETYEMVLAMGVRDLPAALKLSERIGDAVARLLVLCQLAEDLAAAKAHESAARVLEQAGAALPPALSERASWLREEADRHAASGRDVDAERLRGRAAALLRGRLEAAADEKASHCAAALAGARERVVAPAPAQQDLGRAAERARRARSLPDAAERAGELLAAAWTYAAGGGAPWLTAVAADPGTPLSPGTTVVFAPAGTGYRSPAPGKLAWSGGAMADELHAAGGHLVRRSGTEVSFLNPETGTLHWTARADEGVSGAPRLPGQRRMRISCVADAATVYVEVSRTDEPGVRLVAREPENGRVRWWRDLPERRPLHNLGPVLLHGAPGDLTALEAATGDVLWRRSLPDPGTRSPAAAGDCLLLKDSRLLRALHLPTGRAVWSWSVDSPAEHTVYGGQDLGDGPVHFLDGPFLIALRRSTGRHLWRFDVGHAVEGPLIEAGTVYVAAYDPGLGGDRVLALDAGTGALRWQRTLTRHRGPQCALRFLGLRAGALYVDVRSAGRRSRFGRTTDPYVGALDTGTGMTQRMWEHPASSDGETLLVGERLVLSRPTLSAYALP